MAYIGSTPTTQSFISGTDYFNGTGSQTAFTLSRTVASVNDIQAVVNNVVQVPNDAYTISGTTITFTSAPSAGTQNVYVRYLSTTTQAITPSQGTVSWNTLNSDVRQDLGINNKNRIINGNMVIDQRNAGASITPTNGQYTVDRWIYQAYQASKFTVQQNAGSVTPPAGFTNYLGATSTSAYSVASGEAFWLAQKVEGYNIADLGWGTANAKTVTLSAWVYSSLTGTFGGVVGNSAGTQSYPFTYTISSANTWTQISVTIVGSTTGAWNTGTNGAGIVVIFSLGAGSGLSGTAGSWSASSLVSATGAVSVVGTNGATFYLTGVQLEVGTQATTFTTAGGSYGAELALCQRYYFKSYMTNYGFNGFNENTGGSMHAWNFPVTMRAAPTLETSGTGSDYAIRIAGNLVTCNAVPTFDSASTTNGRIVSSVASGLTAGQGCILYSPTNKFLSLTAEL